MISVFFPIQRLASPPFLAKRDVGEDLKAESAAFWDKQRAEEAEAKRRNEEAQKNRNAPAPSAGRNMGKVHVSL